MGASPLCFFHTEQCEVLGRSYGNEKLKRVHRVHCYCIACCPLCCEVCHFDWPGEALHMDAQMKAPERIETTRLVLHRPTRSDAEEIFSRYASDAEVTTFVGFRTHKTLDDTHAFLSMSDAEWERWPAGPYLIRSQPDNVLMGSTGLTYETPYRAMTGYILAKDAWGRGYATEALRGIVDIGRTLGVRRLYALCHLEHRTSCRVLDKCGFSREGILRSHMEFPNLLPGEPADVFCYSLLL
jgi:RimJ/RimL family protein N-acetyltransferase